MSMIVAALNLAAQRNRSPALARVARMVEAAAAVVGRDFDLE